MKNIVYLSTSVNLLVDDELIDILKPARKNNAQRNVTGVLLYSEGTFLQVLEGDAADVEAIYRKIELDPRHKNIIKLVDEKIDTRSFADWAMGFTTANTAKVADLVGYLEKLDNTAIKKDDNAAVITLKTFIDTNKLTVRY